MSRDIVLAATEHCERLLKVMRERDIPAIDFAIIAMKLPRARDPAAVLGKLILLLAPYKDIGIIADTSKKLAAYKRRLKNTHTDPQLVAIAAGGYDASGEPETIGGASYITGAGASTELQRQYVRAELHRAAGTLYTPPEYTGAEEAVSQYKLDAVLNLEKANLAAGLKAFAKYAGIAPATSLLFDSILTSADAALAAVKTRDTERMRAALQAEAGKLASSAYLTQLATHIRQDVAAVLPYKPHARSRHALKKRIAAAIAALRSAVEIPLPQPDEAENPPPAGLPFEEHYERLQAYFKGEYARMPWFAALEAHLNSVATLAADLREAVHLLTSPEHLDTCLDRQIALYTTILDAQQLARHFGKAEYRQIVEYNFSKYPKLVSRGNLVLPK